MATTKRKFRSSASAVPVQGEEFKLPSLTVPDMTMPLREIINRSANGIALPIMSELEYSEDMPDTRGMDLAQLDELKRNTAEEIDFLDAQYNHIQREITQRHMPAVNNDIEEAKVEEV